MTLRHSIGRVDVGKPQHLSAQWDVRGPADAARGHDTLGLRWSNGFLQLTPPHATVPVVYNAMCQMQTTPFTPSKSMSVPVPVSISVPVPVPVPDSVLVPVSVSIPGCLDRTSGWG